MSASDILNEIVILLPDAIVFGSLLIGVLTISPVQALFFFSQLESFGFLYFIQQFIGYLNGKRRTDILSTCKSKYHNLTFQDLIPTLSASNPPYGMYTVAFAASYVATSLNSLSEELEVIVSPYNLNNIIAAALSIIAAYAIYLFSTGCNTIDSIILASLSGATIAILIVYQNILLFGKQSINFIGIPVLRNKTADGSPIYLCT